MRVLITGAAGFIGSHLVDSQLQQGNHVRATDLHVEELASQGDNKQLEIVRADITDASRLRSLVEGVDVVYHLASAHLDVTKDATYYYAVNVEATRQLLVAADAAGVQRFVYCSSNGVLGEIEQLPADENTPCRPTNIYEKTKLLGEQAVLDFAQKTGVDVIVARPAWVYGPRCPRTARLLRMVGRGRFFMFGDGSTLRHPIYVADAVRGLELCAAVGKTGEVYFLAGDRAVSLETLIKGMAEALDVRVRIVHLPLWLGIAGGYVVQAAFKPWGRRPPISRRTLDFFIKDNAYDISKAKLELGFAPETGFVDGIQKTVEVA